MSTSNLGCRRRTSFCALGLTLAMATVAACSGGSGEAQTEGGAESVTLTLAHESSTDSLINEATDVFVEAVGEASDGAVAVQVHPNGELGDEEAIASAVGAGSIDMGLGGVIGSIDERLDVTGLPFLFEDLDHVHAYLDSDAGQELLDLGEQRGYHMLGVLDSGFRQFAFSEAVKTPEDLAGKNVRTPAIPAVIETMEAYGALPESIPLGETYSALQTGVVDGVEPELRDYYDNKWHEVANQLSMVDYTWLANFWYMNAATFEGLDPEAQEAVESAARETIEWYRGEFNKEYEEVTASLKEEGTEFHEVDREAFASSAEEVYDVFRSRWGEDFVNGVIEDVESVG